MQECLTGEKMKDPIKIPFVKIKSKNLSLIFYICLMTFFTTTSFASLQYGSGYHNFENNSQSYFLSKLKQREVKFRINNYTDNCFRINISSKKGLAVVASETTESLSNLQTDSFSSSAKIFMGNNKFSANDIDVVSGKMFLIGRSRQNTNLYFNIKKLGDNYISNKTMDISNITLFNVNVNENIQFKVNKNNLVCKLNYNANNQNLNIDIFDSSHLNYI